MENYIVLEMIGEGAFGKVYKGQRKCTNQIVAIKKISKKGKKEKELKNLRQEIDISRGLYHENIVQLLDSFETNTEFCLVSELAPGQLFEIIEEDKRWQETEIKKIAIQLCSSLFYLHSNSIIHRDIKPQNVLISASGIIKICDFGFARAIDNKTMITSIKGTPLYMAPELLKEYPYNKKADLWSLGVILYELYVGQPPFYTNNFQTLVHKIKKEDIRYPDSMNPIFKDFLRGWLDKNPKDRWDWPKILSHPFWKETDSEKKWRLDTQEKYRKWIIRWKNDKIFNWYENESFIAKFVNNSEVDNETKMFSTFETSEAPSNRPSSNKKIASQAITSISTMDSSSAAEIWKAYETRAATIEGATSLRIDPVFAEKILSFLKDFERRQLPVEDHNNIGTITRILYNILTRGKFDANNNIDITRNQVILNIIITLFQISHSRSDLTNLVNDLIKVIGLYIKFYCFTSNGIDFSICANFLSYFPKVLAESRYPPNVGINILKCVGWMITVANINPKRSLWFYKSFLDFNIIETIIDQLKLPKRGNSGQEGYKESCYKASLECIHVLLRPINGETHSFPFLRTEEIEAKFEGFNNVKTAFSHIDLIKKKVLDICINSNIFDILLNILANEPDMARKFNAIWIIIALIRYNCNEVAPILLNKSSNYISLINMLIIYDMPDKKKWFQYSIILLSELVVYCNKNSWNVNSYGFKFDDVFTLLSKSFFNDSASITLILSLLSNYYWNTNKIQYFSPNLITISNNILKSYAGICQDETKKFEGTNFGYHNNTWIDHILNFLEIVICNPIGPKHDVILKVIEDCHWEDSLIEFITNTSYKNDITPNTIIKSLEIIMTLLKDNSKMVVRKFLRGHFLNHWIIFLKKKQLLAIKEWPGYSPEKGKENVLEIITVTLSLLSFAVQYKGITEDLIRGDFLSNWVNLFDIVGSDFYSQIIQLLNCWWQVKQEEAIISILVKFFSETKNVWFISKLSLLNESKTTSQVLEDTWQLLSSWCRKSEIVYPVIDKIGVFNELNILLSTTKDSNVKARSCNWWGNMWRYNYHFYAHFKTTGIMQHLINCWYDNDSATRKFACFAIGNAAFINDSWYPLFKTVVGRMVELTRDPDENTRANSAGAWGNFMRCSEILWKEILDNKAPEALLSLVEKESETMQIIKVGLFALGNFCNHKRWKPEMDRINIKLKIEVLRMRYQNEPQIVDHIDRIMKKLNS